MPFQRELRDLAYVPRWSIVRVAKTQSVAEHSYFTTVYAMQLAREITWGADWFPMVEMALWHDVEECFTGDMPGPVKHKMYGAQAEVAIAEMMEARFGGEWASGSVAYTHQGFHEAKAIIKVASLLDDTLFLMGELQRGNEACHAAAHSVIKKLREAWEKLPCEKQVRDRVWQAVRAAIMKEREGHSLEEDKGPAS